MTFNCVEQSSLLSPPNVGEDGVTQEQQPHTVEGDIGIVAEKLEAWLDMRSGGKTATRGPAQGEEETETVARNLRSINLRNILFEGDGKTNFSRALNYNDCEFEISTIPALIDYLLNGKNEDDLHLLDATFENYEKILQACYRRIKKIVAPLFVSFSQEAKKVLRLDSLDQTDEQKIKEQLFAIIAGFYLELVNTRLRNIEGRKGLIVNHLVLALSKCSPNKAPEIDENNLKGAIFQDFSNRMHIPGSSELYKSLNNFLDIPTCPPAMFHRWLILVEDIIASAEKLQLDKQQMKALETALAHILDGKKFISEQRTKMLEKLNKIYANNTSMKYEDLLSLIIQRLVNSSSVGEKPINEILLQIMLLEFPDNVYEALKGFLNGGSESQLQTFSCWLVLVKNIIASEKKLNQKQKEDLRSTLSNIFDEAKFSSEQRTEMLGELQEILESPQGPNDTEKFLNKLEKLLVRHANGFLINLQNTESCSLQVFFSPQNNQIEIASTKRGGEGGKHERVTIHLGKKPFWSRKSNSASNIYLNLNISTDQLDGVRDSIVRQLREILPVLPEKDPTNQDLSLVDKITNIVGFLDPSMIQSDLSVECSASTEPLSSSDPTCSSSKSIIPPHCQFWREAAQEIKVVLEEENGVQVREGSPDAIKQTIEQEKGENKPIQKIIVTDEKTNQEQIAITLKVGGLVTYKSTENFFDLADDFHPNRITQVLMLIAKSGARSVEISRTPEAHRGMVWAYAQSLGLDVYLGEQLLTDPPGNKTQRKKAQQLLSTLEGTIGLFGTPPRMRTGRSTREVRDEIAINARPRLSQHLK